MEKANHLPNLHVFHVSFPEDIVRISFKFFQFTKIVPLSPPREIHPKTYRHTMPHRQNQRELQAACVAYGAAECQSLQGSCRCR